MLIICKQGASCVYCVNIFLLFTLLIKGIVFKCGMRILSFLFSQPEPTACRAPQITDGTQCVKSGHPSGVSCL